jgi:hypothetical protein
MTEKVSLEFDGSVESGAQAMIQPRSPAIQQHGRPVQLVLEIAAQKFAGRS